jgi:uncharacterized protein (TIGR03437 family)
MVLLLLLLLALDAAGQVCRVSVSGINRNRRVIGGVNVECPVTLHTVPFGNWGVTSNFGQKVNGNQFQGWCHDSFVCDNNGNCNTSCQDGWYEWNSCTDNSRYRAPNCTLYNTPDCTQQVSPTGVNVHGTRTVDVPVRCPSAAGGGCEDLRTFSNGVNFMSLYELDPATGDELIQSLYFPQSAVTMACNPWSCDASISEWVPPQFYDSPTQPARVYAEMATLVNSAVFLDPGGVCNTGPPPPAIVNAATYRAPVAPDSLASAFGEGLATGSSGVTATVTDAAGITRNAPVFYTSPLQINFLIPAGVALGTATVQFVRPDGLTTSAQVRVTSVSPGLFDFVAISVNPDGSQTVLPSSATIDLTLGDVYLVLYGTGFRGAAPGSVRVTIGGVGAQVLYAGPQFQYQGLDQANVRVPASLAGRGPVSLQLTTPGSGSNPLTVTFQ